MSLHRLTYLHQDLTLNYLIGQTLNQRLFHSIMDTPKFYAFPPFICWPKVIQKMLQYGAEGTLVVPDWPNQLWCCQFCNMITKDVLLPTLQLRAAIVSGKL